MVEMHISPARMSRPVMETTGSVPPQASPGRISSAPPSASAYPVPTNTSMRLPRPRVMRPAMAEHSALSTIMPSPSQVKPPLSPPSMFSAIMPRKPITHPTILLVVRRSLSKNTHANITSVNTLIELRMAARDPALCESPK